MKVSQLIKELGNFDSNFEVIIADEIEGNDCECNRIEAIHWSYDGSDKNKIINAVRLRWNL